MKERTIIVGEPIWVYDVEFSVDTIKTKEIVKVYGEDMIKKILEKKYSNCKIEILDSRVIRRESYEKGE